MSFKNNYRDTEAHFIAAGRTLDFIKKYEYGMEHADEAYAAIAKEYGAKKLGGSRFLPFFIFDQPVTNPALELKASDKRKDGTVQYLYEVSSETPEGKALWDRIADIPKQELSFHQFARLLTGTENTATNPDRLLLPGEKTPSYESSTDSAIYRKYGDTYVVSVPRVLRGVFNGASKDEADGYTYEWFTPPDSQQVPYSKVVELREKTLGDQLASIPSTRPFGVVPPRRTQPQQGA